MKNFKDKEFIYKDLTYDIIGCAMDVHRELGYGFLEKVYENSLIIALREKDIEADSQVPLKIKFHNHIVGEYFADLIIDNKVIIELKAVSSIIPEHRAQIINYLTATKLRVGMILNFGNKSLEYERIIK